MTNTISTECAVAAFVPIAPCIDHNFARCGRYWVGTLAQSTLRQDSTSLAGLASGLVFRAVAGGPRRGRICANMATRPRARGAALGEPAPSCCSAGGVTITMARAADVPTGSAGARHAA